MYDEISIRWIAPMILGIVIVYALIIGGIHICNNSYTMNHKGIFTDEFYHQNFQKIN